MLISAKFDSYCGACSRQILAGDRISYVRGEKPSHAACSAEGRAVAERIETSRAIDADVEIPAPEGLEYLGYQKAGIAYALARPATLIADEMGLGKTIQAIGVMNALGIHPLRVLVLCPKSLIYNWRRELEKWCVGSAQIIVTNYEQAKKLPTDGGWDLLVCDECHYLKNPKAARTKLVKEIAKRCARKLFLTGTPILNKPIELWSLLQVLAPEQWDPAGIVKGKRVAAGEGAGFFRFAKRFCDAHEEWHGRTKHWNFDGASNLPELQERLRSTVMVRRLKADVLTELPAKRRRTIELESDSFDGQWDESDTETVEKLKGPAFSELSSARHASALAKVPEAIEYIKNALECSQKIVVFCHHQDVAQALADGLESHRVVGPITGLTDADERQNLVDDFQLTGDARVIVGTIGAMGVGHTLTASAHVIFCELSWVPAELSQAEDRCHRIGQRESVLVEHLVTRGGIDALMSAKLIAKQQVADLALDAFQALDLMSRNGNPEHGLQIFKREAAETLSKLRFLAERCDGAHAKDGQGFNATDSAFGKALAACEFLSPRQAQAAQKMLVKYKRQLEGVS